MSTFSVMSDFDNDKLWARISQVYNSDEIHKVDSRLILISTEKDVIAEDVYDRIERDKTQSFNAEDGHSRFVIFSITSYYGIHNKTMWDWLSSKVK